MANTNETPDFSALAKNLLENAHRYAGSEAVKFFKESFVKQGFTDKSFEAWQKTANPLAGKRTLYKQGVLMQSIRKVQETPERIVVESDTPYSEIHNEGGEITVTKAMKAHFWKLYYSYAGKVKKLQSGKDSRSKSNQKLNAQAEFCKHLALMKEGAKIKIPKRQFMGHSDTLVKQFDNWFTGEISTQFNKE
jgi:phage gpG-like protein